MRFLKFIRRGGVSIKFIAINKVNSILNKSTNKFTETSTDNLQTNKKLPNLFGQRFDWSFNLVLKKVFTFVVLF